MKYRRKLNFAIMQRQHVCTARFFLQTFYLVLKSNFNPHQFTNLHYSPDGSQYWDGLLSPVGLQIFLQDSLPSTSQPSFDGLLNITSQSSHQQSPQLPQEKQKSPTKGRDEVSRVKYKRVNSLVSNAIYVVHVRPPRLLWCKSRDIFVGQLITRH